MFVSGIAWQDYRSTYRGATPSQNHGTPPLVVLRLGPLYEAMSYLHVMGRRVECAWFGHRQSAKPTIVLLHEGLGSVGMWGDFPDALSKATGLGVFAYSRFGYGDSDPLAQDFGVGYMHDEALAVLPAVLDEAAIEHPILLGHSDGASIALIYAGGSDNPRAHGLVLEAPHVFVEDISIAGIEAARSGYENGRLRGALERYHGDKTDRIFWAWNRIWLDPTFRSWNIEPFLTSIALPIQVIQGRDDEYGTLAQVDAIDEQCQGPVEKVLLSACGHSPHRAQRDVVLEAVVRYVADAQKS